MKTVETVAEWLVVVGGVSIGLDALAGFNLLGTIFGSGSELARVINILIGVSGIWVGYKMLGGKKK